MLLLLSSSSITLHAATNPNSRVRKKSNKKESIRRNEQNREWEETETEEKKKNKNKSPLPSLYICMGRQSQYEHTVFYPYITEHIFRQI